MLFSSITFLYYYLPVVLLIYFIMPRKYKNFVLLLFSLFFYFYGEPIYILILLFSCIFNFFIGRMIGNNLHTKKATVLLIVSLFINFGFLFYFKYTNFVLQNINHLFSSHISLLDIVMPIGISFFTFQTVGYIVDVYRGEVSYSTNFLDFVMYVTLFPQLVAGPIVRYKTVESEIKERKTSYALFSQGVRRFVIGLAKKVLLANILGELCNCLVGVGEQTIVSTWVYTLATTLQIYFDFSGYSDMAIGLGRMFGFHFLENFNYPLVASSITDFWRRWHISLSSFFKEYIYIPLGGSRVSRGKWIRNITVVWFCTGLWHGASWNFILWGLYFAILLVVEKIYLKHFLQKHKVFAHFYTVVLIGISFIIFSGNEIGSIVAEVGHLFGIGKIPLVNMETLYYVRSYGVLLFISVIAATPVVTRYIKKFSFRKWLEWVEPVYYIVLLLVSTAFLIDASFNPFLYFRF